MINVLGCGCFHFQPEDAFSCLSVMKIPGCACFTSTLMFLYVAIEMYIVYSYGNSWWDESGDYCKRSHSDI